jgi:hypothetical protein
MSNNGLCALGDNIKSDPSSSRPKAINTLFLCVDALCQKTTQHYHFNSLRYCPVNPKRSQD